MMYGCMHGQDPQYLMDFCHPTSRVASRQQLRSASRRLLVVSRCLLNTTARQAFSVVRSSVCMEFFARLLARFWCWQRQIHTTFENVDVRFVLAHTAHWRFHYVYALYKFTLTSGGSRISEGDAAGVWGRSPQLESGGRASSRV